MVFSVLLLNTIQEMELLAAGKNLNKLWVVVKQLQKNLGKQKCVLNLSMSFCEV